MIDHNEVLLALRNVKDPKTGSDIITSRMIVDFRVDGNNISFSIVLQSNDNELKSSLVILTPSDGTIWETHTLCISEADWVSPIKKSILLKFQEFLASPPMLTKAKAQGFQAVSKDLEF